MGEPGRIQAFLGWWRELPTGWRVNVGLYGLAGVSLIALLAQIVVGGDSGPRRVEVAAGRRAPARPTTTAVAPSTTDLPTSTVPPLTTAPPATSRSTATTRAAAGGKPAGGDGGSPPPAAFKPTPTTLLCRNSVDPACGSFSWDPPPGDNAGLKIRVAQSPEAPKVNEEVTFTVTVTDPDHVVTGNCTEVNGAGPPLPCAPPRCPARFGPWNPPAKQGQTRTFTFRAMYPNPGPQVVSFTFRTDRDDCQSPYGSVGTEGVTVQVMANEG